MSNTLKYVLLAFSILALYVVLRNVIKNKMNVHYSMVWILWGLFMVAFALFPELISKIGLIMGIQMASNLVFLVCIFILYCMTFYVYTKLSRHNEDLINMNYEIANLKKKIEELEKKEN